MYVKTEEKKQIYEQYLRDVYRYCLYRLQNKEQAEDVTSETFLKFLEYKTPEKIENVKLWIITVARNIIFNKYKKERIKVNLEQTVIGDLADTPITDAEAKIIDEQLIAQVKSSITELDNITREVLVLKVWEELKFKEIAELIDLNENTVKTIYYKGIASLQQKLGQHKGNQVTPAIIAAVILNLRQEYAPPESFANNLNLSSQSMTNPLPILITKLTTAVAAKPLLVAAGVAVTATAVIGGVAVQSLAAPVDLTERGQYESSSLIRGYRAEVTYKNDEIEETFACDNTGCKAPSEYELPDGEYTMSYVIYDFLGREVRRNERVITIDTTAPEFTIVAPEASNKQEATVTITSAETVKVLVNDIETPLTEQGTFTLSVNAGENRYSIRVLDASGNEAKQEIVILFDDAIDLVVTSPTEGQTVDGTFTVAGTADPGATVVASGATGQADATGKFEFAANYTADKLDITATDKAGNTIIKSVNIKKKVVVVAPTTKVFTGSTRSYSFNYPSSLGTPSVNQLEGGVEQVRFSRSTLTIFAGTVLAYPSSVIEVVERPASPATKDGFSSNYLIFKYIQDILDGELNGTYGLNLSLGGPTSCGIAFVSGADTLQGIQERKALINTILPTLKINWDVNNC